MDTGLKEPFQPPYQTLPRRFAQVSEWTTISLCDRKPREARYILNQYRER